MLSWILKIKRIQTIMWKTKYDLGKNLIEKEDGTEGNISLLCPGFHDPFFSSWLGKSSPSVYCFFSLCGILPEFPFFVWYSPKISFFVVLSHNFCSLPFLCLLRSRLLIDWLDSVIMWNLAPPKNLACKLIILQKLCMQLIILQNKSQFRHSLPF